MALTTQQFQARLKQRLAEEHSQPERWWYMSFSSQSGFLGGCIVRGRGPMHARCSLSRHGIKSPGGEVMFVPLPDFSLPSAQYLNKLLTKEEVKDIFPNAISLRDIA